MSPAHDTMRYVLSSAPGFNLSGDQSVGEKETEIKRGWQKDRIEKHVTTNHTCARMMAAVCKAYSHQWCYAECDLP